MDTLTKSMTIQHVLIFAVLTYALVSCDPAYQVYIHNDLNEVVVVTTTPSVESVFGDAEKSLPLRIAHTDSTGTYRFATGDVMAIDLRDLDPTNDFPIDTPAWRRRAIPLCSATRKTS